MLLSMVSLGDIRKIKELRGKDSVKRHLQSLGFLPGEQIEIVAENPSGIILLIKKKQLALIVSLKNLLFINWRRKND